MNVKLIVEYEGTRYHGWQSQAGALVRRLGSGGDPARGPDAGLLRGGDDVGHNRALARGRDAGDRAAVGAALRAAGRSATEVAELAPNADPTTAA